MAWVCRDGVGAEAARPRLGPPLRPHRDRFLAPADVLGVGAGDDRLAGPRVALAYAVVMLGGWISLTIVGMMLKIVPFLVWYRAFSPRAGREPVPTLAQLSWPRAEGAAYVLLTGGVVLLAATVLAGEAAGIRAAGVAAGAGRARLRDGARASPWHLISRAARTQALVPTQARSPCDRCQGEGRMSVGREQITQALRAVLDPELGMSVVDLGLIYGVEIDGGRVPVTMTLTAQGCPLHESIDRMGPAGDREVPGVGGCGSRRDLRSALDAGADHGATRPARSRRVGSGDPMRGAGAPPSAVDLYDRRHTAA